MYTSLWKESAKDWEEKKEWIWVVLSIFSKGFCHLVGLPVNPPLLPLWLIERMPLQVINGKWRLPKMENQPRHMFTYFLTCFHQHYVLPINPNLTPIQTIFLQHFLFNFFGLKDWLSTLCCRQIGKCASCTGLSSVSVAGDDGPSYQVFYIHAPRIYQKNISHLPHIHWRVNTFDKN